MSQRGSVVRPHIVGSDIAIAASLLALAPVSCLLPLRMWPGFAAGLGRGALYLSPRSAAVLRATLSSVFPELSTGAIGSIMSAVKAEPYVIRLHTARELIAPWAAPGADLDGAAHIEQALAAGKGAVLWVAHFAHNGLAVKKALRASGLGVVHMSRAEHGFSKTAFGIRVLNPIRVAAEAKYAKGRIVIRSRDYTTALRNAIRELKGNGIVSMTAGAWEGRGFTEQPILKGNLKQSVGPVKLAQLSGAALIPAIGLWHAGDRRYQTILLEPLAVDRDRSSEAEVVGRYLAAVEPYVRGYPSQWRDWRKLII